jgi:hypothetical protein
MKLEFSAPDTLFGEKSCRGRAFSRECLRRFHFPGIIQVIVVSDNKSLLSESRHGLEISTWNCGPKTCRVRASGQMKAAASGYNHAEEGKE